MRRAAFLLLFFLAACATPPPETAEIPASRDDVTTALHLQLEMVLQQREELEGVDGPDAERARDELNRLAAEITIRIVRIDPNARPRELVERAR